MVLTEIRRKHDPGKPALKSLYHLNLLHLQINILLISFYSLKKKKNKLDHFITLTHAKIAKGFVIIFYKLLGLMLLNDLLSTNF